MGWLWSSSSSPKDQQQTPSPPQQSPPQQSPPSDNALQPPPNTSTPMKTLTREEQADEEFKKLWASLESDVGKSKSLQQPPSLPQSAESNPPSSESQQPLSSIAPESLYPDTMSCRSAFDYAFFCQSFGGQFVNVYRYGELRSCNEHWDNFWLCMKTRSYSDEERKKAIRDHNRRKAIKYKTGPSSEDVWDLRTEPARTAFQGDFSTLEKEMQLEEEAQKAATT
ncbi:hypothetical protein ASPWEDRAFT_40941 [Aspergillus wentii DTO 134E9]|uniref:Early meiotic induction protein 1 n=1 Tax=Aspergillus wentii DTO 134E9 TaxID=1073089 RepID=A0A1L9RL90_ASPWE|nr:uncharacterized protein ASPWEDRAFT_40941 [Aspergillus wentii DTO 134E9]KAI9924528.1 hypothetical protein MW887_006800 [Aspergillus wentii]OJJ35705.1 hypothetical protein ASPWEDRAFT_40941 [Aspergillus wentii DTO 134E9]